MDDETKRSLEAIGNALKVLQDANQEQIKLNGQLEPLRRQIKADLVKDAPAQPVVLLARLNLISGRDKSSKKSEDYDITFESKMGSATDEHWKLDVNERYQKAVGTVISLAMAALGAPFVFLKEIHGTVPILNVLTRPAYLGGSFLAVSIVSAVIYYFFSAKWAKLALVNQADFFGWQIGKRFVEIVLDLTYFLMMISFLPGVYFMVKFMVTFVPK
ncbi:MAG: hypothetical protein ACHQT6_05100 [Candidatus Acidiferrales bacterium]